MLSEPIASQASRQLAQRRPAVLFGAPRRGFVPGHPFADGCSRFRVPTYVKGGVEAYGAVSVRGALGVKPAVFGRPRITPIGSPAVKRCVIIKPLVPCRPRSVAWARRRAGSVSAPQKVSLPAMTRLFQVSLAVRAIRAVGISLDDPGRLGQAFPFSSLSLGSHVRGYLTLGFVGRALPCPFVGERSMELRRPAGNSGVTSQWRRCYASACAQ